MPNSQLDKAFKALERAQELNPQEPAVEMALALIYGSLGQEAQLDAALDRALALLQEWLPMHLHDALAYYNRGLIYQISRRYEDARLDFQLALQENPNLLIAYMSLAQVEGELGHFSQASDTLWRGIKLAEESGVNPAWAYMNLAIIEEKAQEFSRARAAFQRAVELAPQDPWMFHYYAAFLESRQELDAALLAYQSLAQVAQDRAWGYSQLADFYKKRGMFEEMAGAYRQAVHEDPDNGELHYLLAVTYLELGQPDQALFSFDQAASLGRLAPERYGDYANLLYSIGSYERAIELYQRVLEQTPASWPALTNMAQAQLALGACQEAVAIYTSVLERPELFADEQRAVAQSELERLNSCK